MTFGLKLIARVANPCHGWAHCILVFAFLLIGCGRSSNGKIQGYVEGEFIYVSSPLGGTVRNLAVARGQQVNAGDLLFELDDVPEKAAFDEARARLAQARADLDDARKGKRPSEIESLQAQLRQSQSALSLSQSELDRQEKLTKSGAGMAQDLDKARSAADEDRHRVDQLQADLETAKLGARPDQIAAAEHEVAAREAQLKQAEWNFVQKRQSAPEAALVFDTLYRQGEWVVAAKPVVSLLPPKNVKVRAFVPEPKIGSVRVGQQVNVAIDGTAGVAGKVSFISPQAEFTPPVIYSNDSRAKLVYMIEIVFDDQTAAGLHPGQPVDVEIGG